MILGLTGTYGSGKSTVAAMLREHGAFVIDADAIAREVVEPGQRANRELREAFGGAIFQPDGHLDRPALARIVFSSPEARQRVERIIHPRVRERELSLLEANRHLPLVVLDVPLLFENQLETHCDATCVVTVTEEVREERLRARDGATPEQIARRLAAQLPQDEKVRRADHVIDNSGFLEHTRRQVEDLLRLLLPKER